MKYRIPANWRDTCDGQGCHCWASSWAECGGCKGVDWTAREVYELREEVNECHATQKRMRVGMDAWKAHMQAETKKLVDGAVSPVA
jgi:hypothetical protein